MDVTGELYRIKESGFRLQDTALLEPDTGTNYYHVVPRVGCCRDDTTTEEIVLRYSLLSR